MDQIIVALIGLVGSVLVVLIQRSRRLEKEEHATVVLTLSELRDDIKEDLKEIREDVEDLSEDLSVVESKLDTHIRDHLLGESIVKKKSRKSKK